MSLLVLAGVAVVVGAVVLWPGGAKPGVPASFQNAGTPTTSVAGRVQRISTGACGGPSDTAGAVNGTTGPAGDATGSTGSYTCARTTVAIDGGPDRGRTTTLELSDGPGVPDVHVGDQVRLARSVDDTGRPLYDFADFSRGLPLSLLAGLFALVVVAVARWRGLAALAGLGITFAILLEFAVPALARGETPVGVAVTASAAVLFAVVFLAHGVSLRTASALLGTLLGLGLTAGLSYVAVQGSHLSGLQNEQNTAVQSYDPRVHITGILLAGFIIGSLGVLNDVTVSQASTVFELAALDPTAGPDAGLPARCGSAATTSPAPSTPSHWPTPGVPCRSCCSSTSPDVRSTTSSPATSSPTSWCAPWSAGSDSCSPYPSPPRSPQHWPSEEPPRR